MVETTLIVFEAVPPVGVQIWNLISPPIMAPCQKAMTQLPFVRVATLISITGVATVKVALAWDSDVVEFKFFGLSLPISSVLAVDLDLKVYDSAGTLVGYSGSWDNSYEIAEFRANAGETYIIKIRRWSGTDDVWYGVAWNVRTVPLIDFGDLAKLVARR